MRTTLTLDDDVAKLLLGIQQARMASLKTVVNEALRRGLHKMTQPDTPRRRFETSTASLGDCLIGNVNDVAEALALAEGEAFR